MLWEKSSWPAFWIVVLVACAPDGADPLVDTSVGSTSRDGTTMDAATASGTDATTGSATMDSDTTVAASTGSEASESGAASGTDTDVGPGKPCDLMTIDPSADPAVVIDAGDGAGQIPTVIGEALLSNCGCHYTDNVVGYTDYDTNETPLATHADFHATFNGVFPMEYVGMPVYLAVQQRVAYVNPLPMPSVECGVEDEPGTIAAVDRALFADWLAAGAPDGASYP